MIDSNKITLIGDNHNLIDILRNCIIKNWTSGIARECDYCGSWQFELKGNPFANNGTSNGYASYLMLKILDCFESNGLKMIMSADVTGKYRLEIRKNPVIIKKQQNYTTIADVQEKLPVDFDTWYFSDKSSFNN